MKKSWLFTLILAVLLCLLTIPAYADTPIMHTDGNESTLEEYIANKPMIIVFGRTSCGNTQAFLRGASSQAAKLSQNGVGIIALMAVSYTHLTLPTILLV